MKSLKSWRIKFRCKFKFSNTDISVTIETKFNLSQVVEQPATTGSNLNHWFKVKDLWRMYRLFKVEPVKGKSNSKYSVSGLIELQQYLLISQSLKYQRLAIY